MSSGVYNQRTDIMRDDEIGELADHFDEMAAVIQEKIVSLNSAIKQRDDFMAAFSHEIKTPMTSMIGYAALLKNGGLEHEEKERAISYIHKETKRLEELSQKLLILLGLSNETVALYPVLLGDIFTKVRNAFLNKTDSQLIFQNAHDTVIWAEPDLLADLIINLVRNGFQSSPEDNQVRVSFEKSDVVYCSIKVSDRGRGISEEDIIHIEEPFFRVEKSRAKVSGGTGLGLTLCAQIAEFHNTKLDFLSKPGYGTDVSIRLRLYSADDEVLSCV